MIFITFCINDGASESNDCSHAASATLRASVRTGERAYERCACQRACAVCVVRACIRTCVSLTSKLTLGYAFKQRPLLAPRAKTPCKIPVGGSFFVAFADAVERRWCGFRDTGEQFPRQETTGKAVKKDIKKSAHKEPTQKVLKKSLTWIQMQS